MIAALLVAALQQVPAGPVEPAPWIAEALAWGANQKRVDLPSAKGTGSVRFSTPYLRVALAAHQAKREGRTLDPASLPESLTSPTLQVLVTMLALASDGRLVGMIAANDATLLLGGQQIRPSKLEGLSQPTTAESQGHSVQAPGRQLVAEFPLTEPVPAEVQVLVQYSWVQDGEPRHAERTYKLDLKKARW